MNREAWLLERLRDAEPTGSKHFCYCIIADDDGAILAEGSNSWDTLGGAAHAELACVKSLSCADRKKRLTLYQTYSPCVKCMCVLQLLAVHTVYYFTEYEDDYRNAPDLGPSVRAVAMDRETLRRRVGESFVARRQRTPARLYTRDHAVKVTISGPQTSFTGTTQSVMGRALLMRATAVVFESCQDVLPVERLNLLALGVDVQVADAAAAAGSDEPKPEKPKKRARKEAKRRQRMQAKSSRAFVEASK